MFSPDTNHLIIAEQHKDLMRAMAHQQLLEEAGLQQGIGILVPPQLTQWLGSQLVKWGTKLQNAEIKQSIPTKI